MVQRLFYALIKTRMVRFRALTRENVEKLLHRAGRNKAVDLRYQDLRQADLQELRLNRADLRWADLSGADLSGADLSGARLDEANLSGAVLRGAKLHYARLTGIQLLKACPRSGTNPAQADQPPIDLSYADLYHANLGFADLCKADLSGADLSRARLVVTRLQGANLEQITAIGALIDRADLRNIPWLFVMDLMLQPGVVMNKILHDHFPAK